VSLASVDPTIVVDMRYAGTDNFLGARVDGYTAPLCLLTPPAARALADVQVDLAALSLGLVVFDCYRPQRAVDQFVRWARDPADTKTQDAYYPAVPKSELLERGYIAAHSSHSRGSTVDAGLVRWSRDAAGRWSWKLVDMGTPFDFFDPRSHTDSPDVWERQRRERRRLRRLMERHGFRNLPEEWWHYTLVAEPYPDRSFDVPVAPPGR
jgi:D-alanyl-D-alanine dipeptidase